MSNARDSHSLCKQASNYLKRQSRLRPQFAMVLGSGFQAALSHMDVDVEIPYGKLPGFLSVGVSGHVGRLVIGTLGGLPVIVLKGRTHYYEGYDMDQITFPVRALSEYGIRNLLLTNAAGGINRKFRPGDLMVIEDHINLMGVNPLRGPGVFGVPRFVDLTDVYDESMRNLLIQAGKKTKLRTFKGIYLAVSGPSYETPAEIRAYGRLGADAVGMSTVPEAIVARQCGIKVAGLSCITNLGAGISKTPLSHQEVLAMAEQQKTKIAQFIKTFCELYAKG